MTRFMTHKGRVSRAPRICLLGSLMAACLALPSVALDLAWPDGAVQVASESRAANGFQIATGPFDGELVPSIFADGDLIEEIWHIPGDIGAPARLLGLVGDQLAAQDYQVSYSCVARACGGFDFRYGLPIAEGPEMYVDLGNFHYLTAERQLDEGTEYLALTLSYGGEQGYAHIVRLGPPGALPAPVTPSTRTVDPAAGDGLIAQLTGLGRAVLDDLAFETGASSLSGTRYESLVTLAQYLSEDPARRVVLVGHTDAEGSLSANIDLSEARAGAVRRFLIDEFETAPAQIEATGIGYLAPRASNSSPEGREANRRVEVVLIAD